MAACLAVSAARSGDKIRLILFADQVELDLPPKKGRQQILRIVHELLSLRPKSCGTDIPSALTYFNRVARRRSSVFLLTDFLHCLAGVPAEASLAHATLKLIGLTNARHDLVCVHLADPRESEFPAAGLVTLEDAETGETVEFDSSREGVRRAYAEVNHRRFEALDGALRSAVVDTLRFQTGDPILPMLQRFFETRRGRRSG